MAVNKASSIKSNMDVKDVTEFEGGLTKVGSYQNEVTLKVCFDSALAARLPNSKDDVNTGLETIRLPRHVGSRGEFDGNLGGYDWAAHLAPKSQAPLISWITGWFTMFGWISTTASMCFLCGTMLQAIVIFNVETYEPKLWHATLIFYAITLLAFVMTTYATKIFPLLEKIVLALHVGLFIVLVSVLTAKAPKHPAEFVFTTFFNYTGWDNDVIVWCIGMSSITFVFAAYDGATHLSEELQDAQRSLPKIILASVVLNGIMGFVMLTALLFCMGDPWAALSTPTGYPILEIFRMGGSGTTVSTVMICLLFFMIPLAAMNLLASCGRVVWSIARDHALPYSKYFAHVSLFLLISSDSETADIHSFAQIDVTHEVPLRAMALSVGVLIALGLINIGSTAAFNAIVSTSVLCLNISYIIPIAMIAINRTRGLETPWGPFKLGKVGLPINLLSMAYIVFLSIWLLFPSSVPVIPSTMNYSSLIVGAMVIFSLGFWFAFGRKVHFMDVFRPIMTLVDELAVGDNFSHDVSRALIV
ncbi:hypothetical protein AUP68_13927 [Ilyonectria robusta]